MADYPGYDTFCRYCGKPLIFIRTVNGKLRPCDATPVKYWLSGDKNGVMVYQRNGTYAWNSCTERDKDRKPKERKPSPAALQIREQIAKERAARAAREARAAEKREAEDKLREAEERQYRLF